MSDDRAGYKRPPTATRYRPGESGNPSGRPKRCPSFRETLLARLAAPAGGARHGNTKMQALVATLVDAAISGDARAQALVLGALTRFGESAEQEAQPLSANDQEIVEAYVGSEPAAIDAASETGGDEMAAGEERSDSGTK